MVAQGRAAEKRKAILAAARELFVQQGVDRVSMDVVAAQAKVSKATVYDYFGDKRKLFLAILADASESVNASGRRVIEEHLGDGVAITTVAQLEKALTALAIDLGAALVGSADYAAVFGLVAQQRLRTSTIDDDVVTTDTEELLAERIGHFAERGLLEVEDPRLAADHFGALTVLLAYNKQPVPAAADASAVRQIMAGGVHAFIRAYGVR